MGLWRRLANASSIAFAQVNSKFMNLQLSSIIRYSHLLRCFSKCSDEKNPRAKPYKFSNQKLRELGLEFTPVKQALYDTVKSLQDKGILQVPNCKHKDQEEPAVRIQS